MSNHVKAALIALALASPALAVASDSDSTAVALLSLEPYDASRLFDQGTPIGGWFKFPRNLVTYKGSQINANVTCYRYENWDGKESLNRVLWALNHGTAPLAFCQAKVSIEVERN